MASKVEETFFEKHILGNSHLEGLAKEVFVKYVDTETDRQAIALMHGMSLKQLLMDVFNNTAPVSEKYYINFKTYCYSYNEMQGTCDDYCGDRFGKFGQPRVLRVYLKNCTQIPKELFEFADWNYMSAGLDYFIGYIYGVIYNNTYYISGIQSDFAQRYTFLYQNEGYVNIAYQGNVVEVENELLVEKYSKYIPDIRRCFQRFWVTIFLKIIKDYSIKNNIEAIGIQHFELTTEEQLKGNIVNRIYRELPEKYPNKFQTGTKETNYASYNIIDVNSL